MSRIPHSKPNGTKINGWPSHLIGDAYEGHVPVVDQPPEESVDVSQRPQSLQRLQSISTKGSERSITSGASVASVRHEGPTTSQRRAVFRLLRQFKTTDREALPNDDVLRQHWESDALLNGIPWDEFRLLVMEGWEKVRHPQGSGPLAEALAEADQTPFQTERYTDPQIRRLAGLCAVLQARVGDGPFPLAASAVAQEFKNVSQRTISRWLRLLVLDKVLTIVKEGRTGRATEYRFLGVR